MIKFALFIEALLILSHGTAFAPALVSQKRVEAREKMPLAVATSPTSQVVQAFDDDDHSLHVCLETLEKRVQQGPGALSRSEVADLEISIAHVMKEIVQSLQQQQVAPRQQTPEEDLQLRAAVSQMNATQVSALLQAGLRMDEATTEAAFWEVVNEVNRAEAHDEPLSGDVPTLLHHIFEADLQHLPSPS